MMKVGASAILALLLPALAADPDHEYRSSMRLPLTGVDVCGADAGCRARLIAMVQACGGANTTMKIGGCANLAPAGTGTLALSATLKDLGNRHWHHEHGATIADVRRGKRRGARVKAPECFLVTLREPASRLESGYRHKQLQRPGKAKTPPLDALLAEWRKRFDGGDAHALPWQFLKNFFWPQAGYVQAGAAACANRDITIHVLCTERLRDDWAALATDRFGLGGVTLKSEHLRSNATGPTAVAVRKSSTIRNATTRAWVNDGAFPTDHALWKAFCSGPARERANRREPAAREPPANRSHGKRRVPSPARGDDRSPPVAAARDEKRSRGPKYRAREKARAERYREIRRDEKSQAQRASKVRRDGNLYRKSLAPQRASEVRREEKPQEQRASEVAAQVAGRPTQLDGTALHELPQRHGQTRQGLVKIA